MELMKMISYFLLIICVLISVAFVTYFERKVLGYIQTRKGPNKVGFMGMLQPFTDAVKLFTKEQPFLIMPNFLVYYMCPITGLFISLMIWVSIPYTVGTMSLNLSLMFILCCLSVGVYPLMIAGWSSNCKYSLLGSLRTVAQTISYEVSLAIILMSYMILVGSVNLSLLVKYQNEMWFLFMSLPLVMVWFSCILAETNRTPFDFSEGESELVSGFNTEYGSGGFALIFMAEYSSILFMSTLFVLIFLSGDLVSLSFYFKFIFIVFIFMWVRGTLPRFRYDKLMHLAWKSFLPVSINYLIFFGGLKVFCFSIIYK